MADTYTQIHIHLVFAVQDRMSLIKADWRDRLYKYMVAIIQNHGHKVLTIGGMPDHVHILIGFRPSQALASLVQQVKRDSSEWINREKLSFGRFSWQAGYGAFSYGKSQISAIANYIDKQEEHHKKQTFIDEFKEILDKFTVEYKDRNIFIPIQEDVEV